MKQIVLEYNLPKETYYHDYALQKLENYGSFT